MGFKKILKKMLVIIREKTKEEIDNNKRGSKKKKFLRRAVLPQPIVPRRSAFYCVRKVKGSRNTTSGMLDQKGTAFTDKT